MYIVHDSYRDQIKLFIQIIHWHYKYIYIYIEDDTLRIQHVFPSFWLFPNKNLRPSFFATLGPPKKIKLRHFEISSELRTAAKASKDATTCFTEKRSFCTWLLSAPPASSPHVTTVPSIRTAVKAVSAPMTCLDEEFLCRVFLVKKMWEKTWEIVGGGKWNHPWVHSQEKRSPYRTSPPSYRYTPACWTLCKCSLTLLLSPPDSISPQVTTVLSFRRAAKACMEEAICWTAWSLSRIELLSPPLT